MEEKTLYLSNDKEQLLDVEGNIVAIKQIKDGKVYYQEPEINTQAKGKGKICVGWKSKKVCANWNNKQICIGWEDVEYCVRWEYES